MLIVRGRSELQYDKRSTNCTQNQGHWVGLMNRGQQDKSIFRFQFSYPSVEMGYRDSLVRRLVFRIDAYPGEYHNHQ